MVAGQPFPVKEGRDRPAVTEDVHRLHPAITRPGRCLAQIHIGPLPRDEAAAWLGHPDGIGRDGASLAELYVRRGDLHKLTRPAPDRPVGQYL